MVDISQIRLAIIEQAYGMWRFRWRALLLAWFIALAGWSWVLTLPNRYDVSARVFVNTESILQPLMQGLAVPTDTLSQVSMMTQALLSRPQLEAVAAETGLLARVTEPKDVDQLLESLKMRIEITKVPGQNIYTIAFRDRNPEMAHDVVLTLLNNFMARTLRADRSDSVQAQKFIESQIAVYENRLIEAEERLADFKKKNVGLMPGEGGDYYTRLQTAEAAARGLESEIQALVQRRAELERQIQGEEPVFGIGTASRGAAGGGGATSVDATIESFERQLESLRLKFTDKHPDIVSVTNTLQDLYRLRDEERKQRGTTMGNNPALEVNPVYQDMRMALSRADVELVSLRSQLGERRAAVAYLRRMVDTIPEVEAELNRLNRDYDVVRRQHGALLERLESARLADEMQRDNEEISFDILEPPRQPLSPSAPNRVVFNLFVLFAGLGAGGFLCFALNQFDPVFYSAHQLKHTFGVPVFGTLTIGSSSTPPDRTHRFGIAAGGLLLVFVLVNIVGRQGIEPVRQLFGTG